MAKAKTTNFDNEISKHKYTPTTKISWTTKLSSEFLGTIFLTWMIGLLGVTFSGVKFESLISIGEGTSFFAIGFWLWLDIFLCLAIFARWSCDLNPLVTTYRMITKEDSLKYGLIKIAIQMIAGFIAGLAIISTQEISHAVSHMDIDAVRMVPVTTNAGASALGFNNVKEANEHIANWASFTPGTGIQGITKPGLATRHIIAFLGELIGGFILVWSVFNKSIKNPVIKDMVIALAVGIGVSALLPLGTVAWNPARLIATQWILDVFKPGHNAMSMYATYAAGEFAGIFLFFGLSKLMDYKGIVLWEKWMSFAQVNDKKTINK